MSSLFQDTATSAHMHDAPRTNEVPHSQRVQTFDQQNAQLERHSAQV